MLKVFIGEDGEIVNEEFEKFDLTNNDKKYAKESQNFVLDFVGFIVEKDKMLAVFPKRFFDEYDRNDNQKENIKLLKNMLN